VAHGAEFGGFLLPHLKKVTACSTSDADRDDHDDLAETRRPGDVVGIDRSPK